MIDLLLKGGADPNVADWCEESPLCQAVKARNTKVVNQLLKAGCDPNFSISNSPLHAAEGNTEILDILLGAESVDPNALDYRGYTALFLAAKEGNEHTVALLLSKDSIIPDLCSSSAAGPCNTPLLQAVYEGNGRPGNLAVVKLLLARDDVDINYTNEDGCTALFLLIESWQKEVANLHKEEVKLKGEQALFARLRSILVEKESPPMSMCEEQIEWYQEKIEGCQRVIDNFRRVIRLLKADPRLLPNKRVDELERKIRERHQRNLVTPKDLGDILQDVPTFVSI